MSDDVVGRGHPTWCPLLEVKDCRKEVKQFAIFMEKALLENDEKGGWQNNRATYFADKIYQHAKEMNLAANQKKYKTALNHAIHIANYCMMYHDNYFDWRL